MSKSKGNLEAFRKGLVKLDPPDEVLQLFDRLINTNVRIEFEDTLEDLLVDACRIKNWTKPWERNGVELSFRANSLPTNHPERRGDCGGNNTPGEEQAYRRGYSHGLANARHLLGLQHGANHPVANEEVLARRWRFARIHSRSAVVWGNLIEQDYPCIIRSTARRSGLNLKLRWSILKRDGNRCVICGASAKDGVTLEVDHIVSVADGGTDEKENLRTLCFDCNRGKGADSDWE